MKKHLVGKKLLAFGVKSRPVGAELSIFFCFHFVICRGRFFLKGILKLHLEVFCLAKAAVLLGFLSR